MKVAFCLIAGLWFSKKVYCVFAKGREVQCDCRVPDRRQQASKQAGKQPPRGKCRNDARSQRGVDNKQARMEKRKKEEEATTRGTDESRRMGQQTAAPPTPAKAAAPSFTTVGKPAGTTLTTTTSSAVYGLRCCKKGGHQQQYTNEGGEHKSIASLLLC